MSQAIPSGGRRRLRMSFGFLLHLNGELFLIVNQNIAGKSNNLKLKLPPNHLIDNPRIGLNNLDDLRRNVLIDIIRDGNTVVAGGVHCHSRIDGLEQGAGVDAGDEEAGFVQGFGPFGRCADADGREGMADAGEKGGLLRQGAAIGDHRKGIHLQTIIVMEPQRLVLDNARVELEAGGFEAFAGARVAAVQDGHIVLRCHGVDGREEGEEVLFRVDVFLSVGAQKDVLTLLQPQPLMDIRRLNLGKVLVQDLRHRRARDIGALLGEAAVGQVAAGVLGIGHVDIGDDVDNAAVRLLRQAFVLAAVAGLHVEDRDMQPLGADDAEAGVRVPQHQHRVGFDGDHQLIALGNDIAHGFTQVRADSVHVNLRISELQVLEEHAVKVVIIVLARMRQNRVEILPALIDHGRQPDDLRARSHDDEKLQLAVVFKRNIRVVHIVCILDSRSSRE